MANTRSSLSSAQADDIHALGERVQAHVDARWQAVLEENADKLADAYARGGDMAYGTYLGLLFRPLKQTLKTAGFTLVPDLPGDLDRSREWGEARDGSDQQRWMWSLVRHENGDGLGALVTVVYHDHTGFRLPRAPYIIALSEASGEAVIEALSARSAAFASAQEFTAEVAAYLKSLEEKQET